MEWISIKKDLPECKEWDIDREAFFSERLLTYSPVHGVQTNYLRKDDIYVESFMAGKRQMGMTYKWGVSGDDKSITHWMPLPPKPENS